MKRGNKKTLLLLNIAFLLYSLTSVMSKFAAKEEVLTIKWVVCYGTVLFLLMVYAVLWQFALKKIDLITAYSNKAVVVIWGMLWGLLIFREQITLLKLLGVAFIVMGIFVLSRNEQND